MTAKHPPDDLLTEYALGIKGADTEKHVQGCPACARFVKEVKMVRESVAEFDEEEIPGPVKNSILSIPKNGMLKSAYWHSLFSQKAVPFLIGLGVILAVIFFYIFYVFVV
ncbi:MAG: hypothetical protein GF350_03100 [Chitinivibrionales bacterium]|nr:hypothetical protein [Chitinivibrionales bacterium]